MNDPLFVQDKKLSSFFRLNSLSSIALSLINSSVSYVLGSLLSVLLNRRFRFCSGFCLLLLSRSFSYFSLSNGLSDRFVNNFFCNSCSGVNCEFFSSFLVTTSEEQASA